MAVKVLVPLLGEGVEEVTVTKWLKKEGDLVNELEPLLEVNTDKVDTEIPAPASGTVLKIIAAEGVPAKVGALLALIGKPGEPVEGSSVGSPQKTESKDEGLKLPPSQPETLIVQPSTKQDIRFISPIVAKVAAEYGVSLQQVNGTGLNGRITKNDVLAYVDSQKSKVQVPAAQTSDFQSFGELRTAPVNLKPSTGDQLIKHTVIRRQIAEHMVQSKHTSPHDRYIVCPKSVDRRIKHHQLIRWNSIGISNQNASSNSNN